MSDACAVCKKGKNPTLCEICGFTDNDVITREFISVEDANYWLESVVKLYSFKWEECLKESKQFKSIPCDDEINVFYSNRINNIKNCIYAGDDITIGLRKDGTIITVGNNEDSHYGTSKWRNIIAVATSYNHIFGLRADGSVVSAEKQSYDKREKICKESWKKRRQQYLDEIHTLKRTRPTSAFESRQIEERLEHLKFRIGTKDSSPMGAHKPYPIRLRLTEDFHSLSAITVGGYGVSDNFIVGIKADRTVIIFNSNIFDRYDTVNWYDIVEIAAGYNHIIGLKTDGTVITVKKKNITDNMSNNTFSGSLKGNMLNALKDTPVLYKTLESKWEKSLMEEKEKRVRNLPENKKYLSIEFDTSSWSDIVEIAAGGDFSIGLKKDGLVVAVGKNDDGQCNVYNWQNIISISAGSSHTVGLKKDGSVVAVGKNDDGQCNVSNWQNIIAISAKSNNTVGLMQDGKVIVVGNNENGQCKTEGWRNIGPINKEQLKISEHEDEKQRQLSERWEEKGLCNYCGGTFSLFKKKCKSCGKKKDVIKNIGRKNKKTFAKNHSYNIYNGPEVEFD